MDVGVAGEVMALKIGFLNFNVDTLLDNFLVGYDIVLIDDQTVQVARNIIDLVTESRVIRSQHSASSIDRAVGKLHDGSFLFSSILLHLDLLFRRCH